MPGRTAAVETRQLAVRNLMRAVDACGGSCTSPIKAAFPIDFDTPRDLDRLAARLDGEHEDD